MSSGISSTSVEPLPYRNERERISTPTKNIRKWESLYTGRTTYSGQLSGEHKLREDMNKLDWTLGYAFAAYKEPDRKVVKSLEVRRMVTLVITCPTRLVIIKT